MRHDERHETWTSNPGGSGKIMEILGPGTAISRVLLVDHNEDGVESAR